MGVAPDLGSIHTEVLVVLDARTIVAARHDALGRVMGETDSSPHLPIPTTPPRDSLAADHVPFLDSPSPSSLPTESSSSSSHLNSLWRSSDPLA